MNFREFLNEGNDYKRASAWLMKQATNLGILEKDPEEFKTKDRNTVFYFKKDVDVYKLKEEINKRFPDLYIINSTIEKTITLYK